MILGYIFNFAITFISLLSIDRLFSLFAFNTILDLDFSLSYIFIMQISLMISLLFLFTRKIYKHINSIIIIIYAFYGVIQLGLNTFLSNYVSIKASFDGAGRITGEIKGFLLSIEPITLTIFIIPILMIILNYHFKFKELKSNVLKTTIVILVILFNTLSTNFIFNVKANEVNTINSVYDNPIPVELGLKKLGLVEFLLRDLLTINKTNELNIVEEIKQEETKKDLDIDYSRKIDDSLWVDLMNVESNKTIKEIDEYLYSQKISDKNEYTGIFKDKNLVYVMVEAFDYMAISEELTPTLYMMQNQGIFFSNYYTPKYSCATAESEFISLHSLVPSLSVCTPNEYSSNNYSQSLYSLFSNRNYYTSGYHNWMDEYYARTKFHINYGADKFYSIDELDWGSYTNEWQSDLKLVQQAMPHFINKDSFMSFIITSTLHFFYDIPTTYGDKYLDQVNEVFPNDHMYIKRYKSKAIEVEKAMKELLDGLEKQGILDDTIIVVFPDHHPLDTNLDLIANHTKQINKREDMNMDKTPAFIYSTSLEKPIVIDELMSTFDLAPTIANLFDLEFDPRFYLGRDIFSNKEGLVIFANSDWIIEEGMYYASLDKFVPFNDSMILTDDKINYYVSKVKNYIAISEAIYETNYFSYRDFNVKYID